MLRRLGFQGEGAPNGAEAVKKLVGEALAATRGGRGHPFNVVLMDLNMPVMVRFKEGWVGQQGRRCRRRDAGGERCSPGPS